MPQISSVDGNKLQRVSESLQLAIQDRDFSTQPDHTTASTVATPADARRVSLDLMVQIGSLPAQHSSRSLP